MAHHHHHGTGQTQAPANFGRAFLIGIALNIAYVAIEATFGVFADSLALLADAGHNLSDVLGLVVAWAAASLSARPPSPRFTYGLRGSAILAALFNSICLLIAIGAIAWESLQRITSPAPVAGVTVMVVAAAGIAVNGFTAWLFTGSRDLNIRGAYLHMAADAAVSLGVVAAGLVILLTGWTWLDPVVSLIIVAVIAWATWGLLRDSVMLSLSGVPPDIEPAEVERFLRSRDGVSEIHDLHVWPLGTADVALTVHLVMPAGCPGDQFLRETCRELKEHFGIGHAALQVERDASGCPQAPAHVV